MDEDTCIINQNIQLALAYAKEGAELVLAAARRWLTMNHEERMADAELKTHTILEQLQGIPGVDTKFINNKQIDLAPEELLGDPAWSP